MRYQWAGLHIVAIIAMTLLSQARAQTSYPMITHATPVAVQRGKTAQVTVHGQMNFYGTYKVLFDDRAITGEVIVSPMATKPSTPKPVINSVKIKVTVASDAQLGVHEFRLVSTLGISSIGQLISVEDQVVPESGNNNTRENANKIPVPCVVCGQIESTEDLDFFKFRAESGQIFTFEVICARLQDKIHDLQNHADPLLTLYEAEGREIASNDDYYFADPLLTFKVPKTGDYYLQIRDSKYEGDPRWVYAILATNRPYVSNVYPMAGKPGQLMEVETVGPGKAIQPRTSLRVPSEPGIHQIQLDLGTGKTNPVTFISSPLPQVLEREPNDIPAQATRITIPCGINGRIGSDRDLDHFVFKALKGKAIHFEVKARRFGTDLLSSLDSVLDVMTATGEILVTNDDTFGKDASIVFTPSTDGDHILRIRDLNSKGGDAAVYFIQADWASPDFTLRCDPDKAMIGPGGSSAWHIHVNRINGFAGPVNIKIKGLPKGVTASSLTIPPSMNQGLMVLSAAGNAGRDGANVDLVGTSDIKMPDGKTTNVQHRVIPNEEIYLPGGGRGVFDVKLQSVAVTEPLDVLKIDVNPSIINLKPGQEIRLDVTVERRPDFTGDISLDVLLQHLGSVYGNPLPPGVTVDEGKSKTLLGKTSKGHIVLKAATNAAPIERVPICVSAYISVNFVVKVGYSSLPIILTIQK